MQLPADTSWTRAANRSGTLTSEVSGSVCLRFTYLLGLTVPGLSPHHVAFLSWVWVYVRLVDTQWTLTRHEKAKTINLLKDGTLQTAHVTLERCANVCFFSEPTPPGTEEPCLRLNGLPPDLRLQVMPAC